MPDIVREILRYVLIGLAFGLVWAVMQIANGQVRDFYSLAGPVAVFGLASVAMWCIKRIVRTIRNS